MTHQTGRRHGSTRRIIIAAGCLAITGLPATATSAHAQGAATLRAVGEYRLTMPTMRKVLGASKAMMEGANSDAIDSIMREPALSIEDVLGMIDRYPSAKRAVTSSGLAPREFATAYLTYIHTSRYLWDVAERKAMGQPEPRRPAHVTSENIKFIRDNESELARLFESR